MTNCQDFTVEASDFLDIVDSATRNMDQFVQDVDDASRALENLASAAQEASEAANSGGSGGGGGGGGLLEDIASFANIYTAARAAPVSTPWTMGTFAALWGGKELLEFATIDQKRSWENDPPGHDEITWWSREQIAERLGDGGGGQAGSVSSQAVSDAVERASMADSVEPMGGGRANISSREVEETMAEIDHSQSETESTTGSMANAVQQGLSAASLMVETGDEQLDQFIGEQAELVFDQREEQTYDRVRRNGVVD